MQLTKEGNDNMKQDNIIKSTTIATSVRMSEFIKHHKAKPSIREQKTQHRGK